MSITKTHYDFFATDSDALHDNVASEISAIAVKGTPVAGDFFVIEDSAAANVKKHLLFSALESALNHDSLTGFVANEHLDWTTSVGTIHTGNYIEGGAGTDTTAIHDGTASEISAITVKVTPIGADFLLIEDSAAANVKKHVLISTLPAGSEANDLTAAVTWANVPNANITVGSVTQHVASIDHDLTLNFVADEHVAHAGVSIVAGAGMTGGGTIAATRTLDVVGASNGGILVNANDLQLDINSLASDTPVVGDFVAFEDIGGGLDNKCTITTLSTVIDHDTLINFSADEHVASSAAETLANKDLTATTNTLRLRHGMTFEDPTSSDDLTWIFTDRAITITQIRAVLANGSATPTVTYQVKHHTDRSNVGNNLTTSAAVTSVTTGTDATLSDATVPADSWIWIETSAQGGTTPEFAIFMEYTED